MKIKRKLHNEVFPHRQLKFWQYSVISEMDTLDCYYSKWFLTVVFVPTLLIGGFTDGFIPTFKSLISLCKNPYTWDCLNDSELTRLK